MKYYICLWACILLSFPLLNISAQNSRMEGRSVESFPYPYKHFTFIQPRYDRLNLKDGAYLNSYVLRATKTFDNFSHLRIEIPTADNGDVFGLADIKVRYMHATPIKEQLFIGYGAELTFPTASDEALGAGKWQARPEAGIVYFLGQPNHILGSINLGAHYRFDYAGSRNREHISVLGIVPNIDYWGKNWYVGYYATWTYDFKHDIFDLPIDIECGYNVMPQLTLAAEFIQPLIKKRTYNNEFAIKLRYLFP